MNIKTILTIPILACSVATPLLSATNINATEGQPVAKPSVIDLARAATEKIAQARALIEPLAPTSLMLENMAIVEQTAQTELAQAGVAEPPELAIAAAAMAQLAATQAEANAADTYTNAVANRKEENAEVLSAAKVNAIQAEAERAKAALFVVQTEVALAKAAPEVAAGRQRQLERAVFTLLGRDEIVPRAELVLSTSLRPDLAEQVVAAIKIINNATEGLKALETEEMVAQAMVKSVAFLLGRI